jgi:hypothetical protein
MEDGRKLHYEAVTPALIELLHEIQHEQKLEDFVLGNGTGLALQTGHRQSDDIELYTSKDFNSFAIVSFLNRNFDEQHQLIQSAKGVLQAVVQGIKVTFAGTNGSSIEEPIVNDSVRVMHKKDIAAITLMRIRQRKEAKDFVDIWHLLKEYPLEDMLDFYRQKYQCDDTEEIKKALAESGQVSPSGWIKIKMLKTNIFLSEIPRDLAETIANYDKKKGAAGKKWSLFGKK